MNDNDNGFNAEVLRLIASVVTQVTSEVSSIIRLDQTHEPLLLVPMTESDDKREIVYALTPSTKMSIFFAPSMGIDDSVVVSDPRHGNHAHTMHVSYLVSILKADYLHSVDTECRMRGEESPVTMIEA